MDDFWTSIVGFLIALLILLLVVALTVKIFNKWENDFKSITCFQAGYADNVLSISGEDWCYRAEGAKGEIRLLKSLETAQ